MEITITEEGMLVRQKGWFDILYKVKSILDLFWFATRPLEYVRQHVVSNNNGSLAISRQRRSLDQLEVRSE